MNAQQAGNLRVLIRHMETKVTRTLDMDKYAVCGTPGCALGEAAVCPELAHLGLGGPMLVSRHFHGDHFVEYQDNPRLFASACLNAWQRTNVTPQEWAAEARLVLAENGHSMDTKPDPFPAFMACVLEPVAVTA